MIELVRVTPKTVEVCPMETEAQARRVAPTLEGEVFLAVDGEVTHWYRRLIEDRPFWQPIEVEEMTDDYALMARLAVPPVDPWTNAAVAVRRITCYSCEKRYRSFEIDVSTALCEACLEAAGIENEHNDGYHVEPRADCPDCQAAPQS